MIIKKQTNQIEQKDWNFNRREVTCRRFTGSCWENLNSGQTKTNPASPAASVASGQSETRTLDRQTTSPARWPPGNSNSSFQENHGKRIQITSFRDRPRPLLSGGVLWEMCKWRIVAISCCVARYFNLRHVNDYRSYLIKGRTPLIETWTIGKVCYAGVLQRKYARKPRRMPIRPMNGSPVAEELNTLTGITKNYKA